MLYPTFIYHFIFFVAFFFCLLTLNFERRLKNAFLSIFFVMMLFVGGFRGNFTTDYMSYVQIFTFCRLSDLKTVLNSPLDKGYAILNFFVGHISNQSVSIFLITTLFILVPIFCFAKRSKAPFLYVMLYLTIGTFYASFNVMREVLAASFFSFCFYFISRKKIIAYLLVLLLATSIHVSSILMLPFYFILPLKRDKYLFLLTIPVMLGLFIFCNQIFFFFDNLFYDNKFQENELLIGGQTLKTLVLPCFIALFGIASSFFNEEKNTSTTIETHVEKNICFNSVLYWMFFYLLSLKMPILIRYTYFFTPFVVLFLVESFVISNKEKKLVVYSILVFYFVVAYFVYGQYYDSYFFWNE